MAWYTIGQIPWWLVASGVFGLGLGIWAGGHRKKKALAALLGVGLLATLGLGGYFGQKSTAKDLTARATKTLSGVKGAQVRATVKGREVTLTPQSDPKSLTGLLDARDKVADIDGVRSVAFAATDAFDPSIARVVFDGSTQPATLSGLVPDSDQATAINDAAKSLIGGSVDGAVSPLDGVKSTRAVTALPQILAALKDVDSPVVKVTGDSVKIAGSVDDKSALAAAKKAIEAAAPGVTVDLAGVEVGGGSVATADDLANLRGAIIPFENGTAVLTGQAKATLDQVGTILTDNPSVSVVLIGQAGPKVKNLNGLPRQRAEAVKSYLVDLGVPAAQLSTDTRASTDTTSTEEYRRVEIDIKEN